MTEKQRGALEKILAALPDDCRESYRAVAEYAVSLGYMPVLKGVRKDYADFSSSKVKRTILKIMTDPKFPPCLQMKFYAIPERSEYFQQAIHVRVLMWEKAKYDYRCFGCGKCDGTEGYAVATPGGGKGFLCGFCLLPLPPLSAENVAEVKEAMRIQHEFFIKQVS